MLREGEVTVGHESRVGQQREDRRGNRAHLAAVATLLWVIASVFPKPSRPANLMISGAFAPEIERFVYR
jgi:hypothetical protein